MADDTIDGVQVVVNPMHPKNDICDLHARANLWGLGPGCYPKAKAPQTPYHPFYWCALRSRTKLSAAAARRVPQGEAAYLRGLPTLSQAVEAVGSRERAQQVLDGARVDDVDQRGEGSTVSAQETGRSRRRTCAGERAKHGRIREPRR